MSLLPWLSGDSLLTSYKLKITKLFLFSPWIMPFNPTHELIPFPHLQQQTRGDAPGKHLTFNWLLLSNLSMKLDTGDLQKGWEAAGFGAGTPLEGTDGRAMGDRASVPKTRGKQKGQTPAGRQTQRLMLAHFSVRFCQGFGDQRWFE